MRVGKGSARHWRTLGGALGLCLLLAGCIPAADRPSASAPSSGSSPHLEPDPAAYAGHAGELPAAPALAPVSPNAQTVRAQTYIVQPGDTLRGIGNRTGAGSEIIAKENGLVAPFIIRPGQKLRVPGGRYHLVEEGQTGIAIAMAYDVPWSAIVELNAIGEPFILRRGQRLLLPAAPDFARAATLEERAAAFRLDIDDAISGSAAAEEEAPLASSSVAPSPPRPVASAFSGSFRWPASGKVVARFGPAANGIRNSGIDIAAPDGAPVVAAAPGTVSFLSERASLFGGLILLDHGGGWMSAYGYVRDPQVELGSRVVAGQTLASVADRGTGDQPRLHFEIRKDRKPLDPLTRLPRR